MKLFIVATPIGNLSDITARALETFREVDFIFCEDTRVTGRLLKHFEIKKPLVSYHAFNEHKTLASSIDKIKSSQSAALVSDAGMPGISDPGFLLIRKCIEENVKLVVIPGPSAVSTAIVGSGLPCDRYYFQGFLPVKKGRKTRLEWLAQLGETIVLFESPHKLLKSLKQLQEYFGPTRKACVARELSKLHEEFTRGTLEELHADYAARPSVKGEIVIVIGEYTQAS